MGVTDMFKVHKGQQKLAKQAFPCAFHFIYNLTTKSTTEMHQKLSKRSSESLMFKDFFFTMHIDKCKHSDSVIEMTKQQ